MRARVPWIALALALGCSNKTTPGPTVTSVPSDAGLPPTPPLDAAVPDLATTPPRDLAAPPGSDLATTPHDLAAPPGSDLATPPDLANPAGPWPLGDITVYSGATDLIDSSPDEAQNIWAASHDALYLLRPGTTQFVRYTAADGLHIQPFTDPDGHPAQTSIMAIAGGRANEVFVGYYGYESDNRTLDGPAQTSLGGADRVELGADGKLTDLHYVFYCDRPSWLVEDRSVRRMVFAHDGTAAGHLFLGMDHGLVHVYQDQFGDHVHPELNGVFDGGVMLKVGENYGVFVMPSGDVWVAGGYAVGLMTWNPVPHFDWVDGPFKEAFTVYTDDHGLTEPYGYREDQRGVAATADGNVWFASLTHGLWSWNMSTPHNYTSVRAWPSVPTNLLDLAADPDGTLWIVTQDGQLLRFDPMKDSYVTWPGVSDARRVVVDTTVIPRAVYVSMGGGLAVIRAK